MTTAPERDDRVRQACERLIEDIRLTLSPDANFADIEQAVGKFGPEMLRETLQALVDSENNSPTPRKGAWRLMAQRARYHLCALRLGQRGRHHAAPQEPSR